MKEINIPIVTGPGSQPEEEDGVELDYMQMPSGMTTYSAPLIPEPEEVDGAEAALKVTQKLLDALSQYRIGQQPAVLELGYLDRKNLSFVDQILGNGEVSIRYEGDVRALIQESVLAGVWRVRYLDDNEQVERDVIEVADIPSLVKSSTFNQSATNIDLNQDKVPEGVYNARPLLVELSDKLQTYQQGDEPHVINLTLLPQTDEDIVYLGEKLGTGPTTILSRGYGNCRITSTATRNTWWVQYFNSQDTIILNTLELSEVPNVACASQEDIDDSTSRLQEIMEVYQ